MKFSITVAPLLLLLSLQPADSKKITFIQGLQESEHVVPLGMVKDSVDDMYSECQAQMSRKVKTTYFKKENKEVFGKVWKAAKKCTLRNHAQKNRDRGLTKDHFQAICVYTSGHENFYKQFNTAVLTNRSEYGSTFKFHSLHFWLTSAIQILNRNKECITSYRRTKTEFTGQPNQIIRFGSFASSSLSPKLTHFGSKTCFKVHTCHGAYLKDYPHLKDKEQEVLIPPYEMFRILKIQKNKHSDNLSDCEVVYILQSVGFYSNLNCKAAN